MSWLRYSESARHADSFHCYGDRSALCLEPGDHRFVVETLTVWARGGHVGLRQGFGRSGEEAVHLRLSDGGQGNPHGAAPSLRRGRAPAAAAAPPQRAREPFQGERDSPRDPQLDGQHETALEAAALLSRRHPWQSPAAPDAAAGISRPPRRSHRPQRGSCFGRDAIFRRVPRATAVPTSFAAFELERSEDER